MTDPQFAPPPPPGAFTAPAGGYAAADTYAAASDRTAPAGGPPPAEPDERRSPGLGLTALLLSVLAVVVAPSLAAVAGFRIGARLPEVSRYLSASGTDLAFLSPVRDDVLLAELSFWGGTLVGIAAIVLGVVAIVRRRGRGQGVAAVVLGAVGPLAFFLVLAVAVTAGAGAAAAAVYGA